MILEFLTIGHFRCLEDIVVRCDPYVAIIGPNGVGKSTVLTALRFVLDPDYRATPDDWNVCAAESELRVSVHCRDLTSAEQASWSSYLASDGTLAVTRVATKNEAGQVTSRHEMETLRHPAFADLHARYAENRTVFRGEYTRFRQDNPRFGLSNAPKADEGLAQLRAYEAAHPEDCERVVATADVAALLEEAFRVVHVEAVSNLVDVVGDRNSVLSTLINDMLWPDVLAKPELIALQEQINAAYRSIFPADDESDLAKAGALVTASLQQFAPGTELGIAWNEASAPKIAPPRYHAVVTEDGVAGDITRKGHGVQRAVIVAILNAMNERRNAQHAQDGGVSTAPTTILLVEEPELYQYPARARYFAESLKGLACTAGIGHRTQVVLTTHSPYFVSVSNFTAVRLLRREADGRQSPRRQLSQARLEDVYDAYRQARGQAATGNLDIARARYEGPIDIGVREGFFAEAVVIMEGASDVAALTAALAHRLFNADARGVALLDAGGVEEIDRLFVVFAAFGIRTYVAWDADRGRVTGKRSDRFIRDRNRRILSLVGATPEDYPKTVVSDTYAVFEADRETTLAAEFGSDYSTRMKAEATRLGYIDLDQAMKVPGVVRAGYEKLLADGKRSRHLDNLCEKIEALVS
jgi:putative ATP-dependent endonuclease of OLD family